MEISHVSKQTNVESRTEAENGINSDNEEGLTLEDESENETAAVPDERSLDHFLFGAVHVLCKVLTTCSALRSPVHRTLVTDILGEIADISCSSTQQKLNFHLTVFPSLPQSKWRVFFFTHMPGFVSLRASCSVTSLLPTSLRNWQRFPRRWEKKKQLSLCCRGRGRAEKVGEGRERGESLEWVWLGVWSQSTY